ncbi:MAG: MarR family transcriptional regulator [Rhizobiaceae bacterium]|nr:MarR family transcriptional regulator [Rhizobiaceae bacterium]
MLTQEQRFRRFARAVTTELGALEESFLGRGRSLGAARVLNAVGRGITDVASIRAYLDLDSGLMSRLLRSLETEGLILTSADPGDARRRLVALSEAGAREFQAYEDLSDARARNFLVRSGRIDKLLGAIDLVATALIGERIDIREVDPRNAAARACLEHYYRELDDRFEDGFDVSLSRDPDVAKMAPPRGAFLVAMSDTLPIGCVALSGDGTGRAEVKRLWVDRSARGFGFGRLLMSAVEATARQRGIFLLRLDTNRALPEAVAFYRRAGWREIERFNDDPYAHFFFEKKVSDHLGSMSTTTE